MSRRLSARLVTILLVPLFSWLLASASWPGEESALDAPFLMQQVRNWVSGQKGAAVEEILDHLSINSGKNTMEFTQLVHDTLTSSMTNPMEWEKEARQLYAMLDDVRVQRVNELLAEVVAKHPNMEAVIRTGSSGLRHLNDRPESAYKYILSDDDITFVGKDAMAAKNEFNRLAGNRGLEKLKVKGFTVSDPGRFSRQDLAVLNLLEPEKFEGQAAMSGIRSEMMSKGAVVYGRSGGGALTPMKTPLADYIKELPETSSWLNSLLEDAAKRYGPLTMTASVERQIQHHGGWSQLTDAEQAKYLKRARLKINEAGNGGATAASEIATLEEIIAKASKVPPEALSQAEKTMMKDLRTRSIKDSFQSANARLMDLVDRHTGTNLAENPQIRAAIDELATGLATLKDLESKGGEISRFLNIQNEVDNLIKNARMSGNPELKRLLYTARWQAEDMLEVLKQWSGKEEEFAAMLERLRTLRPGERLKVAEEAIEAKRLSVAKGGPGATRAAAELEMLEKGLKPSLQTPEGEAFFSKCVGSPGCKKLMISMSVAGVGTTALAGPRIYNAMVERWKDGGWTEDLSSAAFVLFESIPGAMTFQALAKEGVSTGAAFQFVTEVLYLYPGAWPYALTIDVAKMTWQYGREWQLQSYQDSLVDILATSGVFEGHSFKALATASEQIPRDKLAQFLPKAGTQSVRNPNKPQEWMTADLTKLASELYSRRYSEEDPVLNEMKAAYQQTWRKIALREGIAEMEDWQWFQAAFSLYDYLAGWETVCSAASKWKDNWCQLLDQYANAMRKRARAVYPQVMVPHLITLAEEAHKAVTGPQEMVKELMELQRALEELRGSALGFDLAQEVGQRAAAAADPRFLTPLPDMSTERQKQLAQGKYLIQATQTYKEMAQTAGELRGNVAEKTGLTMAPVLRFSFSGDYQQDNLRHQQSRRGFAIDTARLVRDISTIKHGPPMMEDETDRQALMLLAEVIYPERGSLDAGNQATVAEQSGGAEDALTAPQSPKDSIFHEQYGKALEKVRALYLKTADLKKMVEAGAEIVPHQSVLKAGEPVFLELRFKNEKLRQLVNERAITFRWSADNVRAGFTEPFTTKTSFTTPEEGKVVVGVVLVLAGTDPAVTAEIRKKLDVAEGKPDVVLSLWPRQPKPGAKVTAAVRPRGKLAALDLQYAWRCQNCSLEKFDGAAVKLTAPKEGTGIVSCTVTQVAENGSKSTLTELSGEVTVSPPHDKSKQPVTNQPQTDPPNNTPGKDPGEKKTEPGTFTETTGSSLPTSGLSGASLGTPRPSDPRPVDTPYPTGNRPTESEYPAPTTGQSFASSATTNTPPAFPGFTLSSSGPWEGTADAKGFSATRKEAVLMSAGCKGNDCKASVNAGIEVRQCESFCAKSPQELEASLRNGMDQRGEIRAVSASGFQGYVIYHKARLDYRCPYVDFCWVDVGGPWSGFVRGAIMRDGLVFSINGHAGGTGVIWGHVNTTWSRNDAQFLDSEANAAMNEMMGMIASLRIGTPAFKSDGTPATNKTFGAEEAKPLAVQISSDKQSLAANGIATLKAVAEGGKTPYTYAWSGPVPVAAAKAESVQVQAPVKMSATPLAFAVTVTDAAGKTAAASFNLPLSDLKLSLSKTAPAEAKVPVGGAVALTASLTEGGKAADSSKYVIRWEPSTEVRFAKAEGAGVLSNSATLLRPGRTKLWAVALAKDGATLATVAESPQIEVEAVGPTLALIATPTDPLPGQEVVIRVSETPKMSDQDCSYFWEDSQGGAFSGSSADPRRYSLTLKGDQPVRVTARLKGKAGGEELATQTLSLSPKKVQVKIANLGHAWGGETTKPTIWQPGVGAVKLDKEIVAGMDVAFRADVTPLPQGRSLRYTWSVGESSSLTGGSASRETRAQRSTPGSLEVRVEVRDQNNVLLGRDATTVQVTVSQEAIKQGAQKAGETDKLASEAKAAWSSGDVDTACTKAKAVLAVDAKRSDLAAYCSQRDKLAQLTKEAKAQMAAASGKENTPAGKKAQQQAKAALASAKAINPKYPPLVDAEKELSGADKRAKEEAACTMTMEEATSSLQQKDSKRAKLLFESVINQGCASACKAQYQIGQIRKQEKDLKGAAEAYTKAAACEPANKEYAEAAKRAKQEAAQPQPPPQPSATPPVSPQGTAPASSSSTAQPTMSPAGQMGKQGQVTQPQQQGALQGKTVAGTGPQPTGTPPSQQMPTAKGTPAASGQATPPLPAQTAAATGPLAPPQPAAKGVSLAGKYSGSLSAPQLTTFAEVFLTITPAATGGGQVNGRVICEKLEVGRLQGTVDPQGQMKLTVRGGKDYAEVTGSFTGTLNASGGQGKWQAADGQEKGEGTWTVKAK